MREVWPTLLLCVAPYTQYFHWYPEEEELWSLSLLSSSSSHGLCISISNVVYIHQFHFPSELVIASKEDWHKIRGTYIHIIPSVLQHLYTIHTLCYFLQTGLYILTCSMYICRVIPGCSNEGHLPGI